MVSQLSDRRADKVRNLLYDNWTPSNVNSYDPSLSTSNSDFLPLTTDWWEFGSQYPSITVGQASGTVPGGGNTGFTGKISGGDNAQDRIETVLVTIRAEHKQESSYNGSNDAEDIVKILRDEVERIVDANQDASGDSEIWWYNSLPADDTVDQGANPVEQSQLQVQFGWHKEP